MRNTRYAQLSSRIYAIATSAAADASDTTGSSSGARLQPMLLAPAGGVASSTSTTAASSAEDDDCCIICMDDPKDSVFYECGHMATCIACGSMMQDHGQVCPICRQPIRAVIRVWKV